MTDRPIIFSAPMVRALLGGRKTQTRRIIKPAPFIDRMGNFCAADRAGKVWNWGQHMDGRPCIRNFIEQKSAFGQPGDRLWVREAFASLGKLGASPFVYRADTESGERVRVDAPWRPSIHMSRCASRLTLRITDVRAQRLQDISEEDAIAEGVVRVRDACHVIRGFDYDKAGLCHTHAVTPFAKLWDHLLGPDAWGANPWVWALTFEVEHRNIDGLAAQARAA